MNEHFTTRSLPGAAYFSGNESAFSANAQNERAILYVPFSPLFPFGKEGDRSLSPFPRVSRRHGERGSRGEGKNMNQLKFTRKGEVMLSANLSALSGTLTTEGLIPFYRHEGVDMPVALAIPSNATASYLAKPQRPLRLGGLLMYVAPGSRLVARIDGGTENIT